MGWQHEWALDNKSRNNEFKIGSVLGNVLEVDPLKVGILNDKVILNSDNTYICSFLKERYEHKAELEIKAYSVNVSATDSNGNTVNSINVEDKKDYDVIIKYKEIFKVGDKVLVCSSDDNQSFFIVDKLEVI